MTDVTTASPGTGPRVISLPVEKNDLIASAEQIDRDLPSLRRYYSSRATMMRAYYDALVEAGFETDDALVMCSTEFGPS